MPDDQGRSTEKHVMTLDEIRFAGLKALSRELGPVGMVHFLQQFEPGNGDYTAERHHWLQNPTVDELVQELEQRRRRASTGDT